MRTYPVDLDTMAVWKSTFNMHSTEELAAAESDYKFLLQLAEVDDEYDEHINEQSGINAVSALAAIDAIRAQRERYGIAKPASSLDWPRELLDELKARVPVEREIARAITLRRYGKVLRGCCPFHASQSKQSLVIFPDDNRWWCFGCQVGGDVFSWLQAYNSLDFREAVSYLAAIGNVELPESKRSPRQKGALRVA